MKSNHENLERRLENLDLSDQSQIRPALGRELSQRQSQNQRVKQSPTRRWNMFRNPLPAFILGFFLALAGFSFAHPDTREALLNIPNFFKIGKSTFVMSGGESNPIADEYFRQRGQEGQEAGTIFAMASIYGGYGCGVPEGADPFMKQTPSLKIAAGLVDRPLLVPTYVHEAIPASMRFQKAEILPDGAVALHFGVGLYETRLMQRPAGPNNMVTYSTSTVEIQEDGTRITKILAPQIEEIAIGDKTVFWQIHDEGTRKNLGRWAIKKTDTVIGKFIWEDGGQSFTLDGRFLTKEEGLKIINSLEPFTASR